MLVLRNRAPEFAVALKNFFLSGIIKSDAFSIQAAFKLLVKEPAKPAKALQLLVFATSDFSPATMMFWKRTNDNINNGATLWASKRSRNLVTRGE